MKINKRLGFLEFGIEVPLILAAVILAGSATATTLQLPALHSKVILVQSPLARFAQVAKAKPVIATKIAPLYQSILPAKDNTYSLGSTKFRWKSLQLGPGTLYIQDQLTGKQAGLTVNNGVLLIDGADSLRIGNIQLTATGIKSILSDDDITIGAIGDTGLLSTARGIRFPDGTVQYSASVLTAASTGATGPIGLTGLAGLIGATGLSGSQGSTGSQGLTGAPGVDGIPGEVGAQGLQGATGESGIAGLQGAQGTNGADGVAGTNGADGPRGLTGETGLTGSQGIQGEVGLTGLQGIAGIDGAQGATGSQGIQGVTGLTGASVILGYGTAPSRTVVNYLSVGPANATQANVTVPFPASTASRLTIRVGAAPGNNASYLFTVMNAGVATTITCTIATTATSCSNLVQTSAFAAEADFTIRTTPTGNPTAPVGVSWSIRLNP